MRKGHNKAADGTIGGTQINRPPPLIVQSTDSSVHAAGGTRGGGIPDNPADASTRGGADNGYPGDPGNGYPGNPGRPSPQAEIAATQDMFVVYRSRTADALNAPPVWPYSAKDALQSPDVPAVEVFSSADRTIRETIGG